MEISTISLGKGVTLEHPLMNAAGTCKTADDADTMLRSATSALMIGSLTLNARTGNQGATHWTCDNYSLNALGLPNPGIRTYWKETLPRIIERAHAVNKPVFVSIAGFEPKDYTKAARKLASYEIDCVEINLSCPNIWVEGDQKQIACFHRGMMLDIISSVAEVFGSEHPLIAVKVSPFSDPSLLLEVALCINGLECVSILTTTNTFPNALSYDDSGMPVTTPGEGFAGMSGKALKPIGLGQVRQWRGILPQRIRIIGVGGISTGSDIKDYLRAGADAVQIASSYFSEGPRAFERILSEFVDTCAAAEKV